MGNARTLMVIGAICIFPSYGYAECTLKTLPSSERAHIDLMTKQLAKCTAGAPKKAGAGNMNELPYVEIWIDKDGQTLRREGATIDLTLVVVADGVITLERAFNSETSYNIGTTLPGILRSYYLKAHINGKYRVVSNVLYVKA